MSDHNKRVTLKISNLNENYCHSTSLSRKYQLNIEWDWVFFALKSSYLMKVGYRSIFIVPMHLTQDRHPRSLLSGRGMNATDWTMHGAYCPESTSRNMRSSIKSSRR